MVLFDPTRLFIFENFLAYTFIPYSTFIRYRRVDDYHSTSDSFLIRHGLTSGAKTEHHISFPQALFSKKILEVNLEKVIMVTLMVMPNLFTLPLNGNIKVLGVLEAKTYIIMSFFSACL